MKITYKTSATASRTIDSDTASFDDLESAYLYLMAMADSCGAFPGSKAWREAKTYRETLGAMMAARPDYVSRRNAIKKEVPAFDPYNN